MEGKPWGVTLNTILLVIGAVSLIAGAVGGVALQNFYNTWISLSIENILPMVTSIVIAFAILYILLAYYLWEGNEYAWFVLTIVYIIGLFINGYALMYSIVAIIPFLIQLVLLLTLLHRETISYINPSQFMDWKGWNLD